MPRVLSVEPWAYVLFAALVLIVPLDWLLAAALAAFIHEAGHFAMIKLLGHDVCGIRITLSGAEMQTGYLDLHQELLCALAGPVGSFSLVVLCRYLPKTAICALFQGMYNLIPMYPMDGGRAMHCCVHLLFPKWGAQIEKVLSPIVHVLYFFLIMWLGWHFQMGWGVILVFLVPCLRFLLGKKPCKAARFHVQ